MSTEIERLRAAFPRGSAITMMVTHTSRSFAQSIAILGVEDGRIVNLTGDVARVTGLPFDTKHGGVKIRNPGYGHGAYLYELIGSAIYGEGHGLRPWFVA